MENGLDHVAGVATGDTWLRADGSVTVGVVGIEEGIPRTVTRVGRHLVERSADFRQRPGNDAGLFSHLFIFELFGVALDNEVSIELDEPSDDVDTDHDTLHDFDTVLAVLETDIDTGGSSVPDALHDGGGGILSEHGVDREDTRCNAESEVKSQDEGENRHHTDVLDENTDESKSAHNTEDRVHDRLNPESNSIALVNRRTGTCSSELKETDTSDERASDHGHHRQKESTEPGREAAEELAGTNSGRHIGSTKKASGGTMRRTETGNTVPLT